MKSVISLVFAGMVLTATTTIGTAQSSTVSGSFKVAAAGSCKAWLGSCASRGGSSSLCSSKYAECVQLGCWTEGPSYGNAVHCGLKK